jgi:hypothetical protein
MEHAVPEPTRGELIQALQQWPSNPQAAAAQVRAIADRGDAPTVSALAVMVTTQAGTWQEGLPYARTAAKAGIVGPLNNYFGNMIGDPAHQAEAVEFIAMLKDGGWPVDPFAYVINLAQAQPANSELMGRLLDVATYPPPSGARHQWDELVESTRAASESIGVAAQSVEAEQRRAVEEIAGDRDRVAGERARMEELVGEVTDLANEAPAGELARQYARHAQAEEETADKYTRASIGVAAFAAVATCVIAFFAFTHEHGTGAVLTKAALALPVLAFAAYISRLAAIHRRQAWRCGTSSSRSVPHGRSLLPSRTINDGS